MSCAYVHSVQPHQRVCVLVLGGPSAGGKTTIQRALVAAGVARPLVTVTTRGPRAGEVDGVDYKFMSLPAFEAAVAAGDMEETTQYAGTWYGILRADLDAIGSADVPTVAVLDVAGLEFLRHRVARVLGVYVACELEELRARLGARGLPASDVERRMTQAQTREMTPQYIRVFDVHIDNSTPDALPKNVDTLRALLKHPLPAPPTFH